MLLSRRHALAALSFAPFMGSAAVSAAVAEQPMDVDAVFARAKADLEAKTAAHVGTWHMDTASWQADLERGTITFRNRSNWVITAPVQVIGTRAITDGTWLWAWDHPSIPPNLASHARLVRDFGAAHRIADFTTRKVVADEERSWLFTALACYLAKANGAYRGPAGKAEVFMTFGEITISK